MEIIKSLEKSELIIEFNILDFKIFEDGFYIKIHANLINNTELHIREYADAEERNYSYHWQTTDQQLIMRWDNAPHHKHLESYPHHVHDEDKLLPNLQISCQDILKIIEEKIKK